MCLQTSDESLKVKIKYNLQSIKNMKKNLEKDGQDMYTETIKHCWKNLKTA